MAIIKFQLLRILKNKCLFVCMKPKIVLLLLMLLSLESCKTFQQYHCNNMETILASDNFLKDFKNLHQYSDTIVIYKNTKPKIPCSQLKVGSFVYNIKQSDDEAKKLFSVSYKPYTIVKDKLILYKINRNTYSFVHIPCNFTITYKVLGSSIETLTKGNF